MIEIYQLSSGRFRSNKYATGGPRSGTTNCGTGMTPSSALQAAASSIATHSRLEI